MPKMILNGEVQEDTWLYLERSDNPANQEIPEQSVLVPLSTWLAQKEKLESRAGTDLGVWLDSDEEPESLAKTLALFTIVGINFPTFADGRGYSTARLLRERYNFTGELRAMGDVLLDQLFYMKRCGLNGFALRQDRSAEAALTGLNTFSEVYQTAVDQPLPLFRRRQQV